MYYLACFGDSLIQGFPFGNKASWVAELEATNEIKALNYGLCGDCSDDIFDRLRFMQLPEQVKHIVFLGGAGVSTESGIPDFRSTDGLYNTKYKFPPETILSHTFFENNTEDFYDFYRDKMIFSDVEPNITHKKLAELEKCGKLKAIVTQNIDGLHQKAGSEKVYGLHGSVLRNYCT